jgi:hypothetical protein
MLEAAIRWMSRALEANEPLIREMVHNKANWVLKLAGLGRQAGRRDRRRAPETDD